MSLYAVGPLLTRASRQHLFRHGSLVCRIVTSAYKHILHVENGFLPLGQKSGTFRLEFEKIKTGKLLTPASPADPPAPHNSLTGSDERK